MQSSLILLQFFGGMGTTEMLIVGVIAVLLFGNRLPQVARSMGRSFTEFKKGMNSVTSEWNDAIRSEPPDTLTHIDREPPATKAFTPPPAESESEREQHGTTTA